MIIITTTIILIHFIIIRSEIISPTGRLKLPPPTPSLLFNISNNNLSKDSQPKQIKEKEIKVLESDNNKKRE